MDDWELREISCKTVALKSLLKEYNSSGIQHILQPNKFKKLTQFYNLIASAKREVIDTVGSLPVKVFVFI